MKRFPRFRSSNVPIMLYSTHCWWVSPFHDAPWKLFLEYANLWTPELCQMFVASFKTLDWGSSAAIHSYDCRLTSEKKLYSQVYPLLHIGIKIRIYYDWTVPNTAHSLLSLKNNTLLTQETPSFILFSSRYPNYRHSNCSISRTDSSTA